MEIIATAQEGVEVSDPRDDAPWTVAVCRFEVSMIVSDTSTVY